MKLKFLDAKNCHALLPSGNGTPVIRRLDECLQGINKRSGSIKLLIKQNEKTINKAIGAKRLINSPFEVSQHADAQLGTVHTQAISRKWRNPALLHRLHLYENGLVWKTVVPLQFLLKGWGDASKGYQCYFHSITQNMDKKSGFTPMDQMKDGVLDCYDYAGITSRNWLLRLKEHIGEVRRGSRKKFHKAWGESLELSHVNYCSLLWDVNQTYEGAMNWEEKAVDKFADGPTCLNMIPGGFKGLKYLHKLRITDRTDISLEERERAIAEYARKNPRKGIPNPFISELWKDDEHYLKVMQARSNTLSPEQVKKIKELHEKGWGLADIVKEVNALNEQQVKRVIQGKTYSRYR